MIREAQDGVRPANIPDALKQIPQWVLWCFEERADKNGELKATKVPYQVNGHRASSTDSYTWTSFERALAAYQQGKFDGMGFVVTKEIGIVGVDLDHCRDPHTGTIEPWARSITDRLGSYTEITPSRTGLRVFVVGSLPPQGRKKGNVEIYESGRFLTVTGWTLEGTE